MRPRLVCIVAALAAMAALAMAPAASAQTPNDNPKPIEYHNSDIIDNGVVQLGVNDQGHLNVCDPELGCVGLTFLPTGNESTAPGCLCEGWGAGDLRTERSGYANEAVDGVVGMNLVDFTSDGTNARSVVDLVGGGEDAFLRVTHDFKPSPLTENLYQVEVTMKNVGSDPVAPVYRRVMDWDTEPTPFNEFVTIEDLSGSANLLYSSNDGFASANPFAGPSDIGEVGPPAGANFFDSGPSDHGALFDFGNFPMLDPGDSHSFFIFYGAAPDEVTARAAVDAVGAEVYSFGQPNIGDANENGIPDGPGEGLPNTFIFAFGGVGGDPDAVGSDPRPPVRLTVLQDPRALPPGGGRFTVTSRNENVGTGDATDVMTNIFDLGPGLSLVGGDNPADLGVLAASQTKEHTWTLEAESRCESYTTSYKVRTTFEPGSGERLVSRTLIVPGTCGKFSGIVTEFDNGPIPGAEVSICPTAGGACTVETTDTSGAFDPSLPAGLYDITARPPADPEYSDLTPVSLFDVRLDPGEDQFLTLVLGGPTPIPPDMSIGPSSSGGFGIPTVYWGDTLTLTKRDQCIDGRAFFEVRQGGDANADGKPDDVVYADPGMNETNRRVGEGLSDQTDTIPPFFGMGPIHGYADIFVYVDCPPYNDDASFPDAGDSVQSFTIYIDPSGFVHDLAGNPIAGATVTLFRSDSSAGPFVQVPDGSLVMSPANRTNPDTTDAAGHFGWDVTAGFYKVTASKAGCVDPDDGSPEQETGVLTIPPPVTDLDLRLDCAPPPPPPPPSGETCMGEPATIVGTEGADNLVGTAGDDVIVAKGGNDTVNGAGGADLICLGAGNDVARGGGGADRIKGEGGNDRIDPGEGNDRAWGDGGNDLIDEDAGGADSLYGGTGRDCIDGGIGDDNVDGGSNANNVSCSDFFGGGEVHNGLNGGAGDDRVFGNGADDNIYGGPGIDVLGGGNGADALDGGDGDPDLCDGALGVDTAVACEILLGIP